MLLDLDTRFCRDSKYNSRSSIFPALFVGLIFLLGCSAKFNNPTGSSATSNATIVQSSVPSRFYLGQSSFTENIQLEKGIVVPSSIAVEGIKLVVTDTNADRVLIYNKIPTQDYPTPDVVIGKQNVKSLALCKGGSTFSATAVVNPLGVHIDNGKLYIADSGNNRVLIFNSIPTKACTSADLVLGQKDFTTHFANRGLASPRSNSMSAPYGITTIGNKLVVSDTGNNRILVWNDKTNLTSDATADVVIGQSSFTSSAANSPSVSASTLSAPRGIHTDGSRLFVADSSNNRVLIYSSVPSTSGAAATYVMGQTSMTVAAAVTAQNRMRAPYDVKVIGSKVFVSEFNSSRISVWNSIPSANGVNASYVLGQNNFTGLNCNQSASGTGSVDGLLLCNPSGIASDGSHLFISDQANGRVLIWDPIPSATGVAASRVIGQPALTPYRSSGNMVTSSTVSGTEGYYGVQSAFISENQLLVCFQSQNRVAVWNSLPNSSTAEPDFVLGQPNFSSYVANNDGSSNHVRSEKGMSIPRESWTDGNKLAVADRGNSRILIWNTMPKNNFTPADIVLGQSNFTTATNNYLSMGFRQPEGIISDGTKLIIADAGLHRIFIWNTWPTITNQIPDVVLGQPNKTSVTANNGGVSAKSLSVPVDVLLVQGKLVATETGNNRILIWNSIPTVDFTPADIVLGQPDFTSSHILGSSTAIDLKTFVPTGLGTDSHNRLYVSAGYGRILVWNTLPVTNYAPADWIAGTIQPDHPLVAGSSEFTHSGAQRSFAIANNTMYIADSGNGRLYGLPVYNFGFYTDNDTNSTTGKLTALSCEGTSHVLVNEGSIPLGNDSGWQECSTTPGAIQFNLANSNEGVHILKVWMKQSISEIKSDPILLPLVYNISSPLPPPVKLESTNPGSSTSLSLTVGTCTGSHVLVAENSELPTPSDPRWTACSGKIGDTLYTLKNLASGSHTLYIWSKSRAGNVSFSPSTVSFTYSP